MDKVDDPDDVDDNKDGSVDQDDFIDFDVDDNKDNSDDVDDEKDDVENDEGVVFDLGLFFFRFMSRTNLCFFQLSLNWVVNAHTPALLIKLEGQPVQVC